MYPQITKIDLQHLLPLKLPLSLKSLETVYPELIKVLNLSVQKLIKCGEEVGEVLTNYELVNSELTVSENDAGNYLKLMIETFNSLENDVKRAEDFELIRTKLQTVVVHDLSHIKMYLDKIKPSADMELRTQIWAILEKMFAVRLLTLTLTQRSIVAPTAPNPNLDPTLHRRSYGSMLATLNHRSSKFSNQSFVALFLPSRNTWAVHYFGHH